MTRPFQITTVVLALACASSVAVAAQISFIKPHIIGGEAALIENHPYQVFIEREYTFKCGGALLTEKHIVTAAHCFHHVPSRTQLKDYKIGLGSTSRFQGVTTAKLSRVVLHPDYDDNKMGWDVAVATLAAPVEFSQKIQPISLVAKLDEPKAGDLVTETGWGIFSTTYNPEKNLRAVTVPVVSRFRCQEIFANVTDITDIMFCAGGNRHTVSSGDSGGPVINQDRKLVGIISFGLEEDVYGAPAVHVSIAQPRIQQFILENIQQV